MTFPGYVADHSAKTLVDGGATHNFIYAAFAAAKGLKVQTCRGRVLAAGTEDVHIKGYVVERIRIQSLSEEVKLYGIDFPSKEMHAVLGQCWLLHHSAVISSAEKCVMVHAGGKRCKLKCNPNAPALKHLSQMPCSVDVHAAQGYAQGKRQSCLPCQRVCSQRACWGRRAAF